MTKPPATIPTPNAAYSGEHGYLPNVKIHCGFQKCGQVGSLVRRSADVHDERLNSAASLVFRVVGNDGLEPRSVRLGQLEWSSLRTTYVRK
jgi:hypothetical protein